MWWLVVGWWQLSRSWVFCAHLCWLVDGAIDWDWAPITVCTIHRTRLGKPFIVCVETNHDHRFLLFCTSVPFQLTFSSIDSIVVVFFLSSQRKFPEPNAHLFLSKPTLPEEKKRRNSSTLTRPHQLCNVHRLKRCQQQRFVVTDVKRHHQVEKHQFVKPCSSRTLSILIQVRWTWTLRIHYHQFILKPHA